MRRRSSSFVKSHAQFACSFVNALATAHNRYQLFTILRLRRSQNPLPLLRLRISPVRTLVPHRRGLCFLFWKVIASLTPWLPLCAKSHAGCGYALVNAGTTSTLRYQLFAGLHITALEIHFVSPSQIATSYARCDFVWNKLLA